MLTHKAKEIEKNREILGKIFEVILFCGRQNIPLRGHEDSGPLSLVNPEHNDGNFRALLRLIASMGVSDLKKHFENAPRNAWYISPMIQNEIINISGEIIQRKIVAQINQSKCFSVLADETTDISTIEQLSICVRYMNGSSLEEDFLTFVPVIDLTGEGLADTILTNLRNLGIDLAYLRGQSYDGASAMSGKLKGVKSRILEKFPKAIYTYCSNHCLNLVVSDACTQPNIRNMIGTLKETCNFFSRSAIRHAKLTQFIKESGNQLKYQGLISLCETRWVERHESVIRFIELFPITLEALEDIELKSSDSDTKTKSHCLQKALTTFDFIISLHCCAKLLSLSLPLSRNLQGKYADLQLCYNLVTELTATLMSIQNNDIIEFKSIFVKSSELATKLDIEIKIPRRCSRQNYRSVVSSTVTDPETYYRNTIFVPFINEFLTSITTRFENHTSNICALLNIVPAYVNSSTVEEVKQIFEFYKEDITSDFCILEGEYTLWKNKWSSTKANQFPQSVVEALEICDHNVYPNIFKLLQILCSLPITTASVERTFSNLRRLKTYLRNTMSQDRLTGLALLNIYYQQNIDTEEVINEFKKKNRKILL